MIVNELLTFDIGGTSLRAGVVTRGALTASTTLSSEGARDAASAAEGLEALLRDAAARLGVVEPDGVVVALPGPVVGGRVARLPTLRCAHDDGVDGVAIARRIWPHAAIWVCNDLTAAGYAFVGEGHASFCITTCGSGIGAKLFVDARPMLGPRGMGGEIGHWQVPGAPSLACDCGGYGHLGALASGRGALALAQRRAREDAAGFAGSAIGGVRLEMLTTRDLVRAYRDDDAWTVAVIAESAGALGHAFGLIHLATAIERFFVIGGFGTALGARFAGQIADAADRACWPTGVDWSEAVSVAPEREWGLIGAAVYAEHCTPNHRP